MSSSGASRPEFDRAVTAHRQALAAYTATASGIAAEAWNAPLRTDGWSPAQVTEHLRLAYVTSRNELEGHGGFRVRTSWWQQRLFRILYLPRIIRKGRMPAGVRAPREIRPEGGPFPQQPLLDELNAEGEQLLQLIIAASGRSAAGVTHPYLGKLSLIEGVVLATSHLRHHHAQIGGPAIE